MFRHRAAARRGSLQARAGTYISTLPKLLRVAIVAEDPLVRSGLVSLLASEPGFVVSAQVSVTDDAFGRLSSAEIWLWDVGSRRTPVLPGQLRHTPTLALVRDQEAALELLRGGALGVLLRGAEPERLASALRAVASGLAVFEPKLLVAAQLVREALPDGPLLTPREAEVLRLMAEGLSNKLIAERLKISEHTAKFHVNAILAKLDAETRTEAVVSAARRGLLML
ncbi:MAG TPA: response regulator transcription factor [Polyangiaceae bacterium]|nr:response regulator transcription factor [Polyangiaceae bacterium]